jgi:hypothetical protein
MILGQALLLLAQLLACAKFWQKSRPQGSRRQADIIMIPRNPACVC